jgi:hypothetical protein
MIKELLLWMFEKLIGKDVLHYKINVQLGFMIFLVIVIALGGWYAHHAYWKLDMTITNAALVPDMRRDINTIEQGILQSQTNQIIINGKLDHIENTDEKNFQRIYDYIQDKDSNFKMDLTTNIQNNTVEN